MRLRIAFIAGLVALLAVVPVAGCGEKEGEEAHEAVEGEPLELGGLIYNVAITRFLNPELEDDAEYLEGLEAAPSGQSYLGVFLTIKNASDEESLESADSYTLTDASHSEYEPVETDSLYALDVGATIPPDGVLPQPDTAVAQGPIQGAMLLFLVEDRVAEERPLELELHTAEGEGVIELDI